MATSTISNVIKDPVGNVVANVSVTATLMPTAGFRVSDASEVARMVTAVTDGTGTWTMTLEQTANITPANSYYEIVEFIPAANGGTRVWTIQVGAGSATVQASLVTPLPAAQASGFLTQASADARYQALGSFGAVVAETAGAAGTSGVSTSASRADHVHPAATGTPVAIGTALAAGSAATFAKSDHVHTGPLGTQGTPGKATTNQGSITTVVDLTSLNTTFTAVSGRRYRVFGSIIASSTVANDTMRLQIQEGSTVLQLRDGFSPVANAAPSIDISVELACPGDITAAAHTYKLTLQRAAGTGTLTMTAGATFPAYIIVEDIGT